MLSDATSLDLAALSELPQGERWIDVDLSAYSITAYIGQAPVLRAPAVTGAP